jgi:tetratricopeptide (TPR) repeat protein
MGKRLNKHFAWIQNAVRVENRIFLSMIIMFLSQSLLSRGYIFIMPKEFNLLQISRVISFCFLFFAVQSVLSQTQNESKVVETLVDAGGFNLHFTIIHGTGTPILFEAGGGDSEKVWNRIAQEIADITNATVITYDRIGLGRSEINKNNIGIEDEIRGLETALKKLGFQNRIMLVSHSLGGFYNTFYASRNPKKVAAIVFIDANLPCFFTEEQFLKMKATPNFRNMVEVVRKNPLPTNLSITEIVSEKTLFEGTPDADRWKACHAEFASASPNRKSILAYETGHYIFFSNPQLVVNAIITLYANKVMPSKKSVILERAYSFAQNAVNEDRRKSMKYRHSEDDLNEWGYALLNQNETEKALEVFKLNVFIHPQSANVYDSLADAYLKAGNKKLALENYKKTLEINPDNKNAQRNIESLEKELRQ